MHPLTTAVVCPDKFRGTLDAAEAAAAMAAGARRAGFETVRELPLADGGEGTLDALVSALGGSRRRATVTGPLGDPVDAEWAMLPGGTAVVEMAQASGLRLVQDGQRDPLRATSRGTGELLAIAIREGARQVIVGVGGSASTDGGLAAVEALGWSLHHVPVTVACDVTTPFVDAARRFGPQKGATNAQVALLGRRLERLADEYESRTGVDVRALPGGGAAGGLAGGLAALGATLEPGFEVVARAAGLDDALADDVDLVLTGEGKLDATSFLGKTVGGVLEWATDDEVPHLAVIAGQVTAEAREEAQVFPNLQVLALTDRVWQGGEAFARAATLVEEAAYEAATAALADRSADA
ncbi:MAG: glycerate kinase [Acidimicrobiia bacterium]